MSKHLVPVADVHDARAPAYYGLKLTTTASLGWACAWLFVPGTFGVWLIMVGVYSVLLAAFSLANAMGHRGSVAERAWRQAFFRTSGWLVLSGVLSIVWVILIYLGMALAGRHPFPQ